MSQESLERIWGTISEGATPWKRGEKFYAPADKMREKLLEYVLQYGPFLFEDQRCLLIDVRQFGFWEWQSGRIPVRDVTRLAERAFLSDRKLNPEKYVLQDVIIAVVIIILAIYFTFCSRSEF